VKAGFPQQSGLMESKKLSAKHVGVFQKG
jgi:hypothetical protein